mgnify:CR=1 FL=1
MKKVVHIGMDVGSTTVKIAVMNEELEIIETSYERHYSDTKNTVCKVLEDLAERYKENEFTIALTGSGAMSTAKFLDVPFIQEVVACKRAVEKYIPQTDVVIELGGEDAKIIYFGKSIEQRMNGTCAGGTGAFLDQMASLLNTDTNGLNELAKGYQTIYPIASRCGVFAKTDVQPLLNEGAAKEDIAVSILQAVVNQTISGLACGRPIRGNVAFLGGPLTYIPELRNRFIETLHLTPEQTIIPEEPHLLVAKGAALDAKDANPISVEKLKSKIKEDITFPLALYGKVDHHIVTSLKLDEITYLAGTLSGYDFKVENIRGIAGESAMGEKNEEFRLDEEKLKSLDFLNLVQICPEQYFKTISK